MKRIYVFAILLTIGFSSNSQVLISLLLGDKLNSDGLEFGLEGGLNWSGIDNLETNKRLRTFNVGFYFDIRVKNQLSLYTGVLVKSDMGAAQLTINDLKALNIPIIEGDGKYDQKLNTFNIPALIKYKFKNHFYIEAGPQAILATNAFVEYNSTIDSKIVRIRELNKDNINRLGVGLTGGFGYRLMKGEGITIGIKYYQGLSDVYKNVSGQKANSLNLKVNIPIGAKKEEK